MLIWKSPEIKTIRISELVLNIKAHAGSGPCDSAYGEEHVCSVLNTSDTWCDNNAEGAGTGTDPGCKLLGECIEIGILFGCPGSAYCSTMAPVFK